MALKDFVTAQKLCEVCGNGGSLQFWLSIFDDGSGQLLMHASKNDGSDGVPIILDQSCLDELELKLDKIQQQLRELESDKVLIKLALK